MTVMSNRNADVEADTHIRSAGGEAQVAQQQGPEQGSFQYAGFVHGYGPL